MRRTDRAIFLTIALFLAATCTASPPDKPASVPADSKPSIDIQQKLKTPVAFKFDKRPLREVMDQIAQIAKVNAYLDQKVLDELYLTPSID
jgi:hypothetical protein